MGQLIIGLTGGIGSGKTAASDYFQQLGIDVVDADIVSRQVVEPGTPALDEINQHFGGDLLLADKSLDRAKLRSIIFQDPQAKQWLEQLLHPIIATTIQQQLQASRSPYSILVSPLLFETQQHELTHRNLLIDCPEDIQVQRATQRDNNSEEEIKRIIAQQTSRQVRQQKADDIIINDTDLSSLYKKIDDLHSKYRLININ